MFTPMTSKKMTSLQVVSTAQMLGNAPPIAGSSPSVQAVPAGSFRLLDWLVDLTEAAERLLARCAGAGPADAPVGFANDATGGGSRCVAAARSLHARAACK